LDYYQKCVNFIIVDESSMIDTYLFGQILKFCTLFKAKLLILGDDKQLPPVENGCPLTKLINCNLELISINKLSEIKRQDEGNVLKIIKKMLNNEKFYISDFDNDTVRFENIDNLTNKAGFLDIDKFGEFCKKNNIETTNNAKHLSYYKSEIKKFNTITLNNSIQKLFCKTGRVLITNPFRYKVDNDFYVGDKIVRIENDYSDGVCHANGEEAEIVGYNKLTDTIDIKYEGYSTIDKLTPEELYEDFKLSYALTIHKAQGSQYDTVILYLENEGFIDKSALYTAISRAVKILIIVSKPLILTRIQQKNPDARLSLFMESFNDFEIE